MEMLNEIIPGLSKNSKTWQCCHRGAVTSMEMWFGFVFHSQLMAECRFGPSENFRMVRKFSWNWLHMRDRFVPQAALNSSHSGLGNCVCHSSGRAGTVTLPLLAQNSQRDSLPWLRADTASEQILNQTLQLC